jgi:hypothetical protein
VADWTYAYRRTLPDSSYACIEAGGTKDDNGHTDEAHRHYPIRDANGKLDPDHVRNALSRLAQDDTTSCGADKIRAAAKELGIGQPAGKSASEPVLRALKFSGPDTVEGLAIPYGGLYYDGKDVDGEAFSPDTDFCFDWFGKSGRPVLYHHGLDPDIGPSVIGRQIDYEARKEGIWAQSQLERSTKFRKGIDKLVEMGALGYSSGCMPHLATKSANGVIKRWPWVELTLTPEPAATSLAAVHYVKSSDLIAHMEEVDIEVPTPLKAALVALDEWADTRDESLPAGVKFAEHADRLLGDVTAFRDRVTGLGELRAKAGRVLSAATRERLATHPAALRQLADDLDELLSTADAGKSALVSQLLAMEIERAHRLGVKENVS